MPQFCIPCGNALGATWNENLIHLTGEILSKECVAKGAHVWLGPTVNISRSPLNGRGFECISEDPHLTGMLAAVITRRVQSEGTLAALKHRVANEQETKKMSLDICVSGRALREIYLKPLQFALKHSHLASSCRLTTRCKGCTCLRHASFFSRSYVRNGDSMAWSRATGTEPAPLKHLSIVVLT